MPNSSSIGSTQPERLQAYLQIAFPSDTVKTVVQSDRSPIVLLIDSHAIYGFAMCDGDLRGDYETAYALFKARVVADKTVQRLEPAFVFCVSPDTSGSEQFVSSVETDVYFCRKFVIGLGDDIGASLASLPFMPLAPVDGAALRPASAQTFLKQAGMPAQLAMHLVVPHERAAKGIFDDCLAGKQGEPTKLRGDTQKGMREVAPSESDVYLERVIIRNVRAYRKEQEFKLGKSVTVLYGPNGFGKTSFFDALDFGVTGSIGRLPRKSDAHFRKTVQHLDSHGEDAYVNIIYNRNGERHTISRRVAKAMTAQLDNTSTERKQVLSALTNASGQAADRVDNFISLFRATHLFSQEQQELTKKFREDCELSTAVVSRMLAVEDYVSAKAKADEVHDQFAGAIATCDRDLETLTAEIDADLKQLAALRAAAANLAAPGALQTQIADIRARLQLEGLSIGDGSTDPNALRLQRAELDGAIGQTEASLTRLGALVESVSELPALVSSRGSLEEQVNGKQNDMSSAQARISHGNQLLEGNKQAFSAVERLVAQVRKAVDSQTWFMGSLLAYRNAERSDREADGNLNRELAVLEAAQAQAVTLDERLRGLENEIAPVTELLHVKQFQHDRLELLLTDVAAQRRKVQRIGEIIAEEQRAQAELNQCNATLRQAQGELAAERVREDNLSENLARISTDQKRLVGLLDEIEGHVEDGICPVCGDDHGSREGLIEKIELRRAIDRSADLANALLQCRDLIKRLRDQVAETEAARARPVSRLRDLAQERTTLETEIASFVTRSNELAVDLLSDTGDPSARTLFARLASELGDLRARLEYVTRTKSEAEAARLGVADALQNGQAAVARWRQVKASAVATMARLRKDERWQDGQMGASEAQLKAELDLRLANLNAATTQFSAARDARDKAQAELDEAKRQLGSANAELTRLRGQLSNANQRLVTLRANLAAAQLPDDTDSAALAAIINEHQATLTRCVALRDTLIRTELSLDAATTAASHVALQMTIREKEARMKRIEKRKRSYQPWSVYFKDACRLLQVQQAQTVGSFTSQYGPRTSVIQRRLRPVYSFDDVEIKEQGTTIIVRVKRGNDELRPVDYFSQSQQQTLLLGLFLTACSSQTWSSFSTVFLDDPVTHFDDLNTYSLIDLISGLLNTDSRQRQFIISTCDDRFLQLALRKFRYLGLAARFYRFESIGRDGPVIREIAGRISDEQSKATG